MHVIENFTGKPGLREHIEKDGYGVGPWNHGTFVLKGHYFEYANQQHKGLLPSSEGVLLRRVNDKIGVVSSKHIVAVGVRLDPA